MLSIIQLSEAERKKSLAQAGRDLGLHPQFAAPDQHSATISLLTRHVDELRMRMHFVETELRTPWYRRLFQRWRRA